MKLHLYLSAGQRQNWSELRASLDRLAIGERLEIVFPDTPWVKVAQYAVWRHTWRSKAHESGWVFATSKAGNTLVVEKLKHRTL